MAKDCMQSLYMLIHFEFNIVIGKLFLHNYNLKHWELHDRILHTKYWFSWFQVLLDHPYIIILLSVVENISIVKSLAEPVELATQR